MTSTSPPVNVTFLIVDDLEDNLLVLEKLLARPDVTILKARSGCEALELLLVHEVALALIDVQMPEMDGFELAGLMRGVERTRHVPIIFVTAGLRRDDWVFQGYDAGAVDFLMKPIDARILRHKADVFYQLYTQRQELARKVKRLHDAEQFRARLIESSKDAILIIDADARVVSAQGGGGAELVPTLSLSAEQAYGWAELWHDRARAEARTAFERAWAGESLRIALQARASEREPKFWDVALTPVSSAEGETLRLLAIARDVTRDRQASAERERLTHKLEETLRFHETFVAAVGHDLRNPLNAIMIASQILTQRLDTPELLDVVARVRSSGSRMMRMLDELSDLARLRLGAGVELKREPQDLSALVHRLVSEHSGLARDKAIELSVQGDPRGTWDGACIERVVSNLLGNALVHGDARAPVHVRLDGRDDEKVLLAIDNGGEIPSELLPRVFEPFRTGRSNGKGGGGLGLGLYIARQLVEAHGGAITAESTRGQTRLSVQLPRA